MSFEIVVRKMPKQKKFALRKQICRKVSLVAVLSNLTHLSSISNTFDFIQERSNIIHNELNGSEVFTATLVSVAIEGVLRHKPIRLLIHEFTEKTPQQIHVSVLRMTYLRHPALFFQFKAASDIYARCFLGLPHTLVEC